MQITLALYIEPKVVLHFYLCLQGFLSNGFCIQAGYHLRRNQPTVV